MGRRAEWDRVLLELGNSSGWAAFGIIHTYKYVLGLRVQPRPFPLGRSSAGLAASCSIFRLLRLKPAAPSRPSLCLSAGHGVPMMPRWAH